MFNTLRNHISLPTSNPGSMYEPIPSLPAYILVSWTLGRGSVVSLRFIMSGLSRNSDLIRYGESGRLFFFTPYLLQVSLTCQFILVDISCCVVVVCLDLQHVFVLEIPSVMLTVLGESFAFVLTF